MEGRHRTDVDVNSKLCHLIQTVHQMVTLVQLYSEQEVFKTSPKVLNDTKVSRISIKTGST